MTPPATATRPVTAQDQAARIITEAFAPAVWAAAMPLIIAVHSSRPSWPTGIGWGLLTIFFCAVVPYGIIWLGVRRGRLTDHHISVREQRRTPLVWGLASVLLGLVLLIILHAPRPLIAMVVVMFAVLLIVTAINQAWKISAHAAVSSGAVTVLIIVFGPPLAAVFLLVAAIGWSRVQRREHTTTQVIAGAITGAAIAAPLYILIA